jgi:predicted TIM-barrel fold metal-dependent hydrolase
MPNIGVDAAVAEMRRALALPGMRGIMLGQWPHGGEQISADDDPLWAAAEEAGVPVSIHVAFATAAQGDVSRMRLSGSTRFYDAPVRVQQLIDTGVFDRFPALRLVLVEVDSSWTPYLRTQMDDRFLRMNPAARPPIKRLPGEYFTDNVLTTFITDPYAIPNRHTIGVSQMMWSSDYPHTGSDWPESWKTIEEVFAGVPDDERHAILAGNALRLYGTP